MTWEDSFVPDSEANSQGNWQSSFVPDNTSPPDYGTRVVQDVQNALQNAGQKSANPNLNDVQKMFADTGAFGNTVWEPVVEGVKSGINEVPQSVKDFTSGIVNSAPVQAVVKPVVGAANAVGQGYQQFAQANPKLSSAINDTVGTAGDMLNTMLIPDAGILTGIEGAKVIGQGALDTGKSIGSGAANMFKGIPAINSDALQTIADTMQSKYNPAMQAARDVPLTQEASDKFLDKLSNPVDASGNPVKFNPLTHDAVLGKIEKVQNLYGDKPLTFGDLEDIKQYFQDDAMGKTSENMMNGTLAKNVRSFRNGLSPDMIDGDPVALQNVQNANASYRAGSQYEQLADLLKNSNDDIGVFQKKLLNQLNNTKSNPFGGWSPEDVQTLTKFAKGTLPENAVGLLGQAGINFNKLNTAPNMLRAAIEGGGSALAPGVGIPLLASGTAAKLGLNALKRGQFQNILGDLESRALPVVPQTTPSVMTQIPQQTLSQIAAQAGGNQ